MVRIRVATSPGTKVSPRPTGLTSPESLWNRDPGGRANDDRGEAEAHRARRSHRVRSGAAVAGRAAGFPLGVFVRLEPYAGKLARTDLMGGWTSNGSSLPDE